MNRQPSRIRAASSVLQLGPFWLAVAVVVGVPLALLMVYSLRESSFLGIESSYTLDNYTDVLGSAVDREIVAKSIGIGLGVAGLATGLASVMAFGMCFRIGRRAASAVLGIVVAVAISSLLVRIYAWGTILGTDGLINSTLQSLGLIDEPLTFFFLGYLAIFVTQVYVYLPLAILLVYSAMSGIDPRGIEASKDLGAGRVRTALKVVMPQARVGLVASFFLVAILASSDYIAPGLVGGTRGLMVGSIIRDEALVQGAYPSAAALAFVFVVALLVSFVVLAGASRLVATLGRTATSSLRRRRAHRHSRILLPGSLSRVALFLGLAYLLVPTLVVVVFSFNSGPTVGVPWEGFTLDWYSDLFSKDGFGDALRSTATVAAVAVSAALLLGVPAAFALRAATSRWAKVSWGAVYAPYVIPGVLLGIALLTAVSQTGLGLGLTVTILAHAALVVPLVVLVVHARLVGLDPRLAEAASDLHSTPARTLRRITLPLIAPSLFAAAVLAAAVSLDELLVSTFTTGTDPTLPVWLFGQARRGFTPGVNALAVLLMCATILAFLLAALALRRDGSQRKWAA